MTANNDTNILGAANTKIILYPRLIELHKKIRRCMELSKKCAEPQCMSLEGPTGAGKSTLVRDYVNLFPRRLTPNGVEIPVFYTELPSPATVKYVASELLRELGDPFHARGTLWSMNSRLIGLIQDSKVELVILDEFSNLIHSEKNYILNSVSDWLKMLIKKTGVPFVVVGIEGKVENVLNANQQLSRLFAYRETLSPFSWSSKESIEEYSRFLQYAEKAIGLPLTRDVPKIEMYYRIFYATEGIVANTMNLIRDAAIMVEESGRSVIELDDLSIIFEERISKHMRKKNNPFNTSADERFVPPKENEHKSWGNKYQRRNNRNTPSVSDTLTAS